MDQWFFFLVLVTCGLGSSLGMTLEEKIAYKNATFTKCKEQEKVPDAIMDDLYHSRTMNGVQDFKCVTKCIIEAYGVFKDGKMLIDKIPNALAGHWDDKAKMDRITKNTQDCVKAVTVKPDPCDYNFDAMNCFVDVLQKERTEFTK